MMGARMHSYGKDVPFGCIYECLNSVFLSSQTTLNINMQSFDEKVFTKRGRCGTGDVSCKLFKVCEPAEHEMKSAFYCKPNEAGY